MRALALLLVALAGPSCAHTLPPAVKACVEQLTPQLEGLAAQALAGQDYETEVAARFAGVASCLVVAAVEAAVDQATHLKLSGPVDRDAVARHGQAWLASRRNVS